MHIDLARHNLTVVRSNLTEAAFIWSVVEPASGDDGRTSFGCPDGCLPTPRFNAYVSKEL
jgi:hypothetical protein